MPVQLAVVDRYQQVTGSLSTRRAADGCKIRTTALAVNESDDPTASDVDRRIPGRRWFHLLENAIRRQR